MEGEIAPPNPAPRPRPFPVSGTAPGPRCGHTLTAIAISGPQGSNTVNYKLVMFGGATALEGSAKPDGTPQAATGPAAGIRLAGATSDVHIMDVRTGQWDKITPDGEPPSPRAAHAAAAVGSMVVIQGGIGPAGLAAEDLHVLDFTNFERPKWHKVVVNGAGPDARYAHTLALVGNRFLVAMGGNDGKNTLADCWALDTSEKPYQWRKITDSGEMPPPRMYATAAARQDGLLLLSGGRGGNGAPLGDAYGLARHRDGRWEWAQAPGAMPACRYQHAAVFVQLRLHVSGGSVGGGRMVDDSNSAVVLDTQAGQWVVPSSTQSNASGPIDLTRRCRHAVAAVGPLVFMYGGLRGSHLLEDLLLADDSMGGTQLDIYDVRARAWSEWLSMGNRRGAKQLEAAATEEAELGQALIGQIQNRASDAAAMPPQPPPQQRAETPQIVVQDAAYQGNVRLAGRAIVVAQEEAMRGLQRVLSIEQLESENRRVGPNHNANPMFFDRPGGASVHKRVIAELLRPRAWRAQEERQGFILEVSEIMALCKGAQNIFEQEPTVLKLKVPIKIFGDLHGQFGDLMRLFEEYGMPSTAGDITYIDYLFLGDYVDRGAHSLETICLLLALKIEYPRYIHLIRGNHEAADINALFGFRAECIERLGEVSGLKVWQHINFLFNWLPLAAIIEDKVICMHGGIGRSIFNVTQIEQLQRPLTLEQGGVVLMDLLWSDPTTNDGIEGVQPSPRGPGLVTFGPDRVQDFCAQNNLQMIVRAHECVMDGFERFAHGHLITLFSATNYCGTANNAGAILVLGRDLVMVPKLIHPIPPTTPRTPGEEVIPGEQEPNTPHPQIHDTWMSAINEERPPTPPRGRPNNNGTNLDYFPFDTQ